MLIQKLLSLLLYPLTQSVLIFFCAFILLLFKRTRTSLFILAFGVSWLSLFSLTFTADKLQNYLERSFPIAPIHALPTAEAIIVLGGAIQPLPEIAGTYFNLGSAADRPVHAARLFHAKKAPFVLVSAGTLPWNKQEHTEANSTADFLVELGVTQESIILETKSGNTHENALNSFDLLNAKGVSRIILVTSAWHMKRAKTTFENVGFKVIPAPTDYESLRISQYNILDWFPNIEALTRSTQAIKEIVGLEVYRLKGWVK